PGTRARAARRSLRRRSGPRHDLAGARRERSPGAAADRSLADLALDLAAQALAHGLERNAPDHRLEERLHDEPLRVEARESPRHEVVEMLRLHVAQRGAVRATHVVGEDLEAGNAVRARLVREQQVPVRLIGVGALRALRHLDEALVDAPG